MIYCIEGTNSIRIREEISRIHTEHGGELERVDGSSLTENQLPDLLSGTTLFAEKRCILVRGLSENNAVWERLGEWVGRIHTDTTLILVEAKLDKRTKTYKQLNSHATLISAAQWTEKDRHMAEEWLRQYAKQSGVSLSPAQVSNMVDRAHVAGERPGSFEIDQMRLVTALRSLMMLDKVTDEAIHTVMPPAFVETVYDLMEAAIRQKTQHVRVALSELRASEDACKVFASLVAQWTQLVTIALVQSSDPDQLTALGIHPYIIKKTGGLAQLFTRQQLHAITLTCADLDSRMKLSEFDPWDGVDRLILAIGRKGDA
jgi:DNA polymerase III delta subunit